MQRSTLFSHITPFVNGALYFLVIRSLSTYLSTCFFPGLYLFASFNHFHWLSICHYTTVGVAFSHCRQV